MPKRRSGPGAPPLQSHVAELRALAHPLRLRMVELFGEQPRTTKQVADLLGQPPTRLYHHVAALERAGLLQLEETRKNRGTVEKWYTTPSNTLGAAIPSNKRRRTATQDRRATVITVLEQSKQEMLTAIDGPDASIALVMRGVMRAPAKTQRAIRDRLLAIITELQDVDGIHNATATDRDDRWALTITFAPVAPRTTKTGKKQQHS